MFERDKFWLFILIKGKEGHFPFFIYYHSCLHSNLDQKHPHKYLLYKDKLMGGKRDVEEDKLTLKIFYMYNHILYQQVHFVLFISKLYLFIPCPCPPRLANISSCVIQ